MNSGQCLLYCTWGEEGRMEQRSKKIEKEIKREP
jgi:hypothetical protein